MPQRNNKVEQISRQKQICNDINTSVDKLICEWIILSVCGKTFAIIWENKKTTNMYKFSFIYFFLYLYIHIIQYIDIEMQIKKFECGKSAETWNVLKIFGKWQ